MTLSPLLLYQLAILAVLIVLLGMVAVNMAVLPSLEKFATEEETEPVKVAVLVPARNEESNIEACLRGLLTQNYTEYSVWLYNDASTDSTGQIARALAEEYPGRLHIVEGTGDPPRGWLGKANACHQLYSAMLKVERPDYLLFTDADVRHAPDTLPYALALAQSSGAGLLSLFPRQVALTWAERLAVPLMQCWAVYGILPLPLAFMLRTGPAFAAANGQFMLFTLEAYESCGGHTAVRSDVLEDVGLARATKRAGSTAILADGGPLVKTRMYTSSGEVWRGYSKNTYAFFGYSPFFLTLGIAVLAALYVVPVLFIAAALPTGSNSVELLYLPVAQFAIAVLTRLILAVRFAYSLTVTLLNPVAMLYLIAILVNSMVWSRTGKGTWKGRVPAAK